jgi:protein-tyrosine phosphatase
VDFSQITGDLFIGTMPSYMHYDVLRGLGVRLVINTRYSRGPEADRHDAPIQLLWLPMIDSPFFPLPLDKLMQGTRAALDTIHRGGKVYVHCAYGRHRSVVMGSCILIAQGMTVEQATHLIKARRPTADPDAFHMKSRILKFEQLWKREASLLAPSAPDLP